MHVERVRDEDKLALEELLLLADEQWGNVEEYLQRSTMYALFEADHACTGDTPLRRGA